VTQAEPAAFNGLALLPARQAARVDAVAPQVIGGVATLW